MNQETIKNYRETLTGASQEYILREICLNLFEIKNLLKYQSQEEDCSFTSWLSKRGY